MKNLLNILCTLLLCLCPWINVLCIFCKSLIENNSKQIKLSLFFLICEFILFCTILIVTFQADAFNYLALALLIILSIAFIYSAYIFLKEKPDFGIRYLLVIVSGSIASVFFILINLINALLAYKDKNYKWILFPLLNLSLTILLIGNIIPGPFFIVIWILNITNFSIWLIVEKNGFLNTFSLSPSRITVQNINTPESAETQYDTNTVLVSESFYKGWTIDDTTELDINLLSIEDIINPIPLKNEHEKGVKNLIVYIRKLNNYSSGQLLQTAGEEGLSSYLDTFFQKLNIEAIRAVYIKALFLILEDYSFKDLRVKDYLEKLPVEQTS